MEPEGVLQRSQAPAICHHQPFASSKTHFNNILSHPRLGLPSGIFRSGFANENLQAFLNPHECHMPCPSHPPWFHHPNNI
jgi:hypothetical protein